MNRTSLFALLFLGVATASFPQEGPGSGGKPALTETQQQGRLIVQQKCSLCHTPQAVSAQTPGPRLTKETGAGKGEGYVEKLILEGSPRMPGFRYGLEPAEVAAVIDYLKTVEPVSAAVGKAKVDPD